MRVLYIYRSLAVWGGIERVLVDKMNYLASVFGYEVYMLTTCQGDHPVPYHLDSAVHLDDLGIQFHRQYQYRGLRKILDGYERTRLFEKRLSERLLVISPDVIVCTTADPVYSIAKVKGKIPLIVESHSICFRTFGEKGLRQRYVAHLLKRGLKKAYCVVALTEGDAVEWRTIHPNVKVIPDIVHLNEEAVSTLQNKKVIWVGRFDYQKRPMEIVKIWQLVYPFFPEWHLDIYGEGEQSKDLIETVQSLNSNIHIHPPTSNIFDAYRESSIMVSTSLFEPFGLVIPEAMSCGLPIIAYDCPYGPSFMINDGITGYLVDNFNSSQFANKLEELMKDELMRMKMGQTAKKSSLIHKPHEIMQKWQKLFEEVHAFPQSVFLNN